MEEEISEKNAASAVNLYDRLKKTNSNDYHFGADVLLELSNKLIGDGKIPDSVTILRLALRDYGVVENKTNQYGYRLLAAKRYAEAIDIFKINAEKFPASANAYDSLAEAYMKDGQKDPAIRHYEKSLELEPNNANAREMLRKLKQN
jgi:tetratricopeptide (TPR) repeat protein